MSDASSAAQDQHDMDRLARGQDSALNDLMERHGQKLFHYLVRSLQNASEAADLSQETFVRVYQHRDRFKGESSFSTWLYAIATNLVRDRYRWRTRHPQVSLDAAHAESERGFHDVLPEPGPDPSARLETEERGEAVRQAIGRLPEELRLPLILAEYEDLPQAEIARILDCTVKAVETRIYRARKQLREELVGWLKTG